MGLFRDVGRRVEELKNQVTEAADREARADCADCGETVFTDRDTCPDCGSEDVVPREPPAEE